MELEEADALRRLEIQDIGRAVPSSRVRGADAGFGKCVPAPLGH